MRKVKIQSIKDKQVNAVWTWQKSYGVWLDWGVNVSFANKKDARRFLAWVNEQLTEMLFVCNDIAGGLYVEFRRAYMVLEIDKRRMLVKMFAHTETYFARIADNSARHAISFSVVKDINDLASLLLEIGEVLRDHNKMKNRFTDARICAGLMNRCDQIIMFLKELPKKYKVVK